MAGGAPPRPARARASALGLDAALLAYGAWCVDLLAARGGLPVAGFLRERPLLALTALPLALLWQTSDASLGQRLLRLRRVTPDGAPAGLERRALAGLAALGVAALVLAPALLGLAGGALLSAALALGLHVAAARSSDERSPAERLAGVRTSFAPPSRGAHAPWWTRPNAWVGLLLLGLTFAVGWLVADVRLGELLTEAERTRNVWRLLAHPDLSIAGQVVQRMVETVFLAFLASTLALPFAFVLGFLGAETLTRGSLGGRTLYLSVRLLLNLTRSIEPVLWAIIFVLWVGIGPFAGMLALWVHSVASLAKLYSEAVEGIDPGPVEAVRSTGARLLPVLRYGVVPQVVPALISFTVYRWDINLRMATILGFVGGGGIGELLVNYMQLSAWSKVGTIILFVTVAVMLMDAFSSAVRKRAQ